ncbi:ZIP family metal transporter [Allopusillimonas soli]|uniref:ZIP family metal transporter n=1 Tax=Allopusillimonas soli TaxID=659016 RepID=A0A853FCP0_9BURK|nr:ZIP family metal transporter [Allopusillimonas soli]NYT37518.1 ZIP family metal transporter [Allopusillimonas soli]TEA74508.1 ZIP family metal transporter [Allopusillimonas soli]
MSTLDGAQQTRPHYTVAILIAVIIAVLIAVDIHARSAESSAALRGALWWGCMAAAATSLGTLPVVLSIDFSQRAHDAMLGFGAGVMLAASSFSLILPALSVAEGQGATAWTAGLIVSCGIVLGALMLLWLDKVLPHEHFIKGLEGARSSKLRRVWLFVLAICLHNFPEGLSIGVGFAGPDQIGGQALATGISIQDIPEGLVVALALTSVGYGRWLAIGVAVLSGLIEPLAALLGVVIIGLSLALLPWGLAMAAGAMLFVISHEIIPESHRQGHESAATGGLIVGFVLMMLLDTALG